MQGFDNLTKLSEVNDKWCPFARATGLAGANRSNPLRDTAETLQTTNCIGHRCMAWRWGPDVGGEEAGYCGLAGEIFK